MSEEQQHTRYIPQDWRIKYGLLLTFLWFVFLFIYIARNTGWVNFMDLPIEEMGTFLEGAFAFLAFLWLVIGLFIQQSVLAQNNEELRRNNLHSEKQTLAIAATELNARQETFFKIAESTRRQIGAVSGMLFISSQGAAGNGSYSNEDIVDVWKQFANGDFEVFSRMFLSMGGAAETDYADLWFGTEIRRRHSDSIIVAWDRLIKLARECDTDNIIFDSLVISAHGLMNGRMRELHPEIKFDPIDGTVSRVYLQQFESLAADDGVLPKE